MDDMGKERAQEMRDRVARCKHKWWVRGVKGMGWGLW